jgi:hypothetical protein
MDDNAQLPVTFYSERPTFFGGVRCPCKSGQRSRGLGVGLLMQLAWQGCLDHAEA